MFGSGMTNEQFNSHLEILAKLIEKTASNVEEAAKIVREAKIANKSESSNSGSFLSFESDNLALPEIKVGEKKIDSENSK